MCGEKAFLYAFLRSAKGSPPRVRGKAGIVCFIQQRVRITPACAGKSD